VLRTRSRIDLAAIGCLMIAVGEIGTAQESARPTVACRGCVSGLKTRLAARAAARNGSVTYARPAAAVEAPVARHLAVPCDARRGAVHGRRARVAARPTVGEARRGDHAAHPAAGARRVTATRARWRTSRGAARGRGLDAPRRARATRLGARQVRLAAVGRVAVAVTTRAVARARGDHTRARLAANGGARHVGERCAVAVARAAVMRVRLGVDAGSVAEGVPARVLRGIRGVGPVGCV
jgi:hypothetical protein